MGSLFSSGSGSAPIAGPDLSYEPEDMYLAGGSTGTSFTDWVERNLKKYGPAIGEAAVKGMGGKEDKDKEVDNVIGSQNALSGSASYMAPGRLGPVPSAQESQSFDYEKAAQAAFRDALVQYILENPKANIKGML
jgi:hypothetical protein